MTANLESGIAINKNFSTLALPLLEGGDPRSIADYRGKKVLLQVFASW